MNDMPNGTDATLWGVLVALAASGIALAKSWGKPLAALIARALALKAKDHSEEPSRRASDAVLVRLEENVRELREDVRGLGHDLKRIDETTATIKGKVESLEANDRRHEAVTGEIFERINDTGERLARLEGRLDAPRESRRSEAGRS